MIKERKQIDIASIRAPVYTSGLKVVELTAHGAPSIGMRKDKPWEDSVRGELGSPLKTYI
jgi:hypothetical protein